MSRPHTAGAGLASVRAPRRTARCSAGVLGVLGSVACAASMILAAVGVGGAAAAASMAGMTGTAPGGALGALVRAGPWLMPAAAALVTAAFALTRRPVTAVPALLAGAVLYAGMYAQHSLPVMYASIAVGYLAWVALALWAVRGSRSAILWHRPLKPPAEAGIITHDVPAKG